MECKANVRARDGQGQEPLHLAAEAYRLEVVKELVSFKADFHAKNGKGETALDLLDFDRLNEDDPEYCQNLVRRVMKMTGKYEDALASLRRTHEAHALIGAIESRVFKL